MNTPTTDEVAAASCVDAWAPPARMTMAQAGKAMSDK
jgi:hypothetical protein